MKKKFLKSSLTNLFSIMFDSWTKYADVFVNAFATMMVI